LSKKTRSTIFNCSGLAACKRQDRSVQGSNYEPFPFTKTRTSVTGNRFHRRIHGKIISILPRIRSSIRRASVTFENCDGDTHDYGGQDELLLNRQYQLRRNPPGPAMLILIPGDSPREMRLSERDLGRLTDEVGHEPRHRRCRKWR
jgi:hypothetical protein